MNYYRSVAKVIIYPFFFFGRNYTTIVVINIIMFIIIIIKINITSIFNLFSSVRIHRIACLGDDINTLFDWNLPANKL
jgi:hypothetical protein